MICDHCGHDTIEPWRHRLETPATFNPNAEFAELVLLIDRLTAPHNQYGRCGQTYSEMAR